MNTINVKQAPLCFLLVLGLSFSSLLHSQVGTKNATSALNGNAVPSDHVRVDDVLWMKTVWQRIDLREKMNHRLYFTEHPTQHRSSLFDHLVASIRGDGIAKAYSTGPLGQNDMFNMPLSPMEVKDLLVTYDTVPTPSLLKDGIMDTVIVENAIGSTDIIAYDLKEVWFIDRERSIMEVRILGICPVLAVFDEDSGEFRGTKRLFWVYYPEVTQMMSKWPVYDPFNDLQYISYDRLFKERRFSARIVKMSNVYDRYISEYNSPVEALVESMEIKENMRALEQDMWNY